MRSRVAKRRKQKKRRMISVSILLTVLFLLLTVYFIDYQAQKNLASALEDDGHSVNETERNDERKTDSDMQVDEKTNASSGDLSQDDTESVHKAEEPEPSDMEENQNKMLPAEAEYEPKKVYITFDDGPGEATVPILDLLDQYNVKATFFMLEPQMRAYPEVTNEIVIRGHQVGLHGVTHNKAQFYRSSTSSLQEMLIAQETLRKITGIHSNLVRVPYGSHPLLTREAARIMEEAGLKIWDWNVDSEDWKFPGGKFVEHTIQQIESFDKEEPIIILLHDRLTTLNHLEELLLYFIENGYEMDVLQEEMIPVQFFD